MRPATTKRPPCLLLLIVGLLFVGSIVIGGSIVGFQKSNLQATQTAVRFNQDQGTALVTAFAQATQEARATAAPIATATARATALLSVTTNLKTHDPGPPYSPYLVGKLLVINQATHQIDTTILSDPQFGDPDHSPGDYILPANLLATTPDEVGTIILLSCRKDQVGWYGNGIPAYQRSCTMTIIDRGKSLVVEKKDFTGPPPPPSTLCSSCVNGVYGDYPATDIVNYLENLPKK